MIQKFQKVTRTFCSQLKNIKYQNNLEYLYHNHTLKTRQPFFELRSGQIDILQEPIDFYIHLHKGIKSAGKRICLSSLYLGTGNLEKFLVANIDNQIKRSKKINVKMLFDYGRGTRLNRQNESTQSVIEHLKTQNLHNNNVQLAFFRNPNTSKIVNLDSESGLREIFGVHHIKCYIFDNDILLSGANLNETYFTERQDRYYYIRNAPEMANYLDDFLSVLINNSYQINDSGDLKMYNEQPTPDSSKQFLKVLDNQFKMFQYSNRLNIKKKQDYGIFYNINDDQNVQYEKEKVKKSDIVDEKQKQNKEEDQENQEFIDLEDDETDQKQQSYQEKLNELVPKYFKQDTEIQMALQERKEKAKTILEESYDEVEVANIVRRIENTLYEKKQKGELMEMGGKVYVFPTIQFPCLNFRQDQDFYENFIQENVQNQKNSKVSIATGYLAFTDKLAQIIANSKNQEVNILTAAPIANSFYKAGRVKGWIPYFYRVFEYNFLKQIKKNKSEDQARISLYEYEKNQWTFHSKGIWVQENNSNLPDLTVIGSSNYSYRSYYRDTELNFCMYSICDKFKEELLLETQRQFVHGQEKTNVDLSKDDDVKLSWFTIQFAKLFKSFL